MDYAGAFQRGDAVVLDAVRSFALEEILDCGQSFRWRQTGDKAYRGIACGRILEISGQGERVVFHNTSLEAFETVWRAYFDLGRDYTSLKEILGQDPTMAQAIGFCPGMRVLRQPPWETLCSFIISQNNNIPRIKGIVDRLCRTFGRRISGDDFDFPGPDVLAGATSADFEPVRAGFRTKYLLDAARLVAGGELELEPLYTLPLEEARASLRRIKGVGPKVAECVLLYGLARQECFPEDVWIKRVLEQYYPQGFPDALRPWAGIAQQYLFHYIRCFVPAKELEVAGV